MEQNASNAPGQDPGAIRDLVRRGGALLAPVSPGVELLGVIYVTTDNSGAGGDVSAALGGADIFIRQEGFRVLGVFNYGLAAARPGMDAAAALRGLALKLGCPFLLIQWNLDLPFRLAMRLREMGLVLITADERAVDPREEANLSLLAKYDACISYYHKADPVLRGLGLMPLRYKSTLNYCSRFQSVDPGSSRPVDVMFIGAAVGQAQTAPRIPLLTRLKLSGIAVACWGGGFQACPSLYGADRAGLPHDPSTGRVDSLFEYYQKARIGLNFDYFHKDRTFKIVLAGALLVSSDTPQIREYFKPGKEIVVFSTVEEMADVCRHYLANESERLAIARRGHEKALARFAPEKVFTRAHRAFAREVAGSRESVARIVRSAAVAALAGGLDAWAALEYLRDVPARFGPGHDYGAMILRAYAALPAPFQFVAGRRAESILVAAAGRGDFGLASLFVPLCLNSLYFNSRLETLLACAGTLEAQGADASGPREEFATSLEDFMAIARSGQLVGEPFADSLLIKRALRQRLAGGKPLAIFGAGGNGRAWRAWAARSLGNAPCFFVDNDPAKHGTILDGAPVHPRETLKNTDTGLILVASTWHLPISLELSAMGFREGEDFLRAPCMPSTLELDEPEA